MFAAVRLCSDEIMKIKDKNKYINTIKTKTIQLKKKDTEKLFKKAFKLSLNRI